MKKLPGVEELERMFRYDPEAGNLVRLVTANSRSVKGSIAGSDDRHGYQQIHIHKNNYRLHRVIYKLVTGVDPIGFDIDHINGDRADNRINNLRLVTRQGNRKNAARSKSNTSGHTGVTYDKVNKKWQAEIGVDFKSKKIGRYKTKAEAIKARADAEVFYGFHANHGRSQ